MTVNNIKALIRPFISVAFVVATVILAVMRKIEAKDILSLTGIIVAFHFGERAAKNGNE